MTDKEDGDALWRRVISDIIPLNKGKTRTPDAGLPPSTRKKIAPATPIERFTLTPALKAPAAPPSDQPPQLDGRTATRLRRGQIAIDGALDLHGLSQARAHSALRDFIIAAQASGHRCVLVITGKGQSRRSDDPWSEDNQGILKQKFPLWMSEPPLNRLVLKHMPAQPRHGGGGAFYVYLKRTR